MHVHVAVNYNLSLDDAQKPGNTSCLQRKFFIIHLHLPFELLKLFNELFHVYKEFLK